MHQLPTQRWRFQDTPMFQHPPKKGGVTMSHKPLMLVLLVCYFVHVCGWVERGDPSRFRVIATCWMDFVHAKNVFPLPLLLALLGTRNWDSQWGQTQLVDYWFLWWCMDETSYDFVCRYECNVESFDVKAKQKSNKYLPMKEFVPNKKN